ncbi:MAG: hypothetical protein JWL75_28 [Parcubacteria group bacterium]|nr:hypothetical protein [Parcubacteria group bacterium]
MAKPKDAAYDQMDERIKNVLTTLNRYRAKDLENKRIDSIMTQLEDVAHALEERAGFNHAQLRDFDFSMIEGMPFEEDENLVRELYSIRNFIEHLPTNL